MIGIRYLEEVENGMEAAQLLLLQAPQGGANNQQPLNQSLQVTTITGKLTIKNSMEAAQLPS